MDDPRKIGMLYLYREYKGIHFKAKYRGKNSWSDCHQRVLETKHAYRLSSYGFRKNTIEDDGFPVKLAGHQIWEKVRCLPKITKVGKSIRLLGYGLEHN